MISAAIQTKLAAIIVNTNIAKSDEEIGLPYCTHSEKETPVLLKEGVDGYEYDCEVAIVDELPDTAEALKESIISAVESLQGTTASGTKIESVEYQGDDPGFDEELKLYVTILRFFIETGNR